MKAFLLAAGTGSRLRPITDHTPKCMLPIGGTPLIDLWLDALHRAEVDEVLVNLHHLSGVVARHLDKRRGPPVVHTSYEPELLGSAGTLRHHQDWVRDEEVFLVINADNLTDFELRDLIDVHRTGDAVATVTAFHSENPSAGGVLEVDDAGRMVGFTEKPPQPTSDLVNAGMYAFSLAVLDEIRQDPPLDIGYHLLPALIGRAQVVPVDGYFHDIGTPEAYRRAREEWPVRAAR